MYDFGYQHSIAKEFNQALHRQAFEANSAQMCLGLLGSRARQPDGVLRGMCDYLWPSYCSILIFSLRMQDFDIFTEALEDVCEIICELTGECEGGKDAFRKGQ